MGLFQLERFEEAKALMRKTMPVARRVLGDSNEDMLLMRRNYSLLLCKDGSTLDDLREGVTTLDACSAARTRPQWGSRDLCKAREPHCAPAKQRSRRRGARKKIY